MSMPTGFGPELRELDRVARQALAIHPTQRPDFAALLQSHALHRLADALAPLERIAAAMEAKVVEREPAEPATTPEESEAAMEIREAAAFGLCTPQEPPQPPSTNPGGHPLDQGGWIRSRRPTQADANADGEVVVLSACGHWGYVFWHLVGFGQPWSGADVDSLPSPPPLPAHVAFPTSEGWIHDRLPSPEDGDEDGAVKIAAEDDGYLHWSHVVPGQPWRHSPFYMP